MRVASVGAGWVFKKCWWGPSHIAGLYNSSISSSWLTNSFVVHTGGGLGNSLCCLHSLGLGFQLQPRDLSGSFLLWSHCATQGTWPKPVDSRRPAGSELATRGQQGLCDCPALALEVGMQEGVKVAPALDVESNLDSPEARLLHSQRAGVGSDARLGISFPNQCTRCPGHPLWAALVTLP